MSGVFGLAAVILSKAEMWVSMVVISVLLLAVELIVEKIGLVDKDYRPILKMVNGIRYAASKNN